MPGRAPPVSAPGPSAVPGPPPRARPPSRRRVDGRRAPGRVPSARGSGPGATAARPERARTVCREAVRAPPRTPVLTHRLAASCEASVQFGAARPGRAASSATDGYVQIIWDAPEWNPSGPRLVVTT
ncbi:hypothetical protein GCM10023329_31850 [Streptomyces sanyensis]|uniref:Uncharacterized protein n=1 Tax=Streptomyces sanyensis TaxID=568869 RepID=A0ABP9AFV7_9ACTN